MLVGVTVGVLAVGVTAALAGPVIYRDFIAAPPVQAPTLSADQSVLGAAKEPAVAPSTGGTDSATSGSVLDAAALAGEWQVADGSEAGYRVDEVLNGTEITVTGRTNQVTGTFAIADTGLTLDSAELTVDVASIITDNDSRDNYFRSQALRTSEFPTATFTLTDPVTLESAPLAGDIVSTEAKGELTIAGKSQPVTAQIELRSDGTTAEIAGSIPITFADFGVEAPRLGFVSVAPTGAVEFQLTAAKP
nr:YceI family protein [Leucobacter exalbidus]